MIRAPFDRFDLRKKRGKRTHSGRFSCTPIAKNQHAADCRIDRSEQQRVFHRVLANNGGKRIRHFLNKPETKHLRRQSQMIMDADRHPETLGILLRRGKKIGNFKPSAAIAFPLRARSTMPTRRIAPQICHRLLTLGHATTVKEYDKPGIRRRRLSMKSVLVLPRAQNTASPKLGSINDGWVQAASFNPRPSSSASISGILPRKAT